MVFGKVEVYDKATGESLMGVSVKMVNLDTGVVYKGVTDSDPNQYPHYWNTPSVDTGNYAFTISKSGYMTFKENDYVGGEGWGIAFPLTVGSDVIGMAVPAGLVAATLLVLFTGSRT